MSKQIDLRGTSKATVRKVVPQGRDTRAKDALRFYTIESISEHRSYTPEGYLLCEGATLSRTGTMLYKADEVPVTPGADGLVTVIRYADDVFAPEAVASANGKSVCNNHPAEGEDISPENWRALEVGVILHPRRGTGDKHDCLVADLLIKDEPAIKLIESGKVQLSCGYDAEYEEIKPGCAKQYGIIINHVAIVENGRCGPRCAILDEDTLLLNEYSPSGKPDIGKRKMTRSLNAALSSLKDALNKTTINRDNDMARDNDSDNDRGELLELALEGLNNRLASIEKRLAMRDRRSSDDDDDRRSRDRRDARRRDDDDRSRDRRSEVYSRDDDDDDRRSRDRRDYRDDDDRSRDDDDDRRSRDRRDARRRDDDDDDRRSRDRRDARRRDDDDRSRDDDDDRRSRDRRDARRRDDDDDAHFIDRRDEKELVAEAGEKNKDRARKSKDSAFLEDSWKETVSLAECLLPGVQVPKFTRDAAPVQTLTKLCEFRKSVLSATFTNPDGRALLLDLNRGEAPDFQGMSCAAARTLFRDAALIAKRINNGAKSSAADAVASFGLMKINNPVISNPAAFNEWAEKHWTSQYPEGEKAN
jgi:hypothetical protein